MTKVINKPVIVLVGPTAIGKTALSIDLAKQSNCEVISMDSMQVYRYMDIGTAKVTVEEQQGIPHHLLDIVDPDEDYDASRFCKDAITAIEDIHSRGKNVLLTGGTGLYLQALVEGLFHGPPGNEAIRKELQQELEEQGAEKMYSELQTVDKDSAKRIHLNDTYRVLRALEVFRATGKPLSTHFNEQIKQFDFKNIIQIGLTCERERLYQRINLRTDIMIEQGFEQEVQSLLDKGYSRELKSMGSIGYKHMTNYLKGDWSYDEMVTLLARDTRRYAKRQYTWFNKNKDIIWHDVSAPEAVLERVTKWLGTV